MGNWDPVRRGKRYCSPGCGRGCTYAEFEKAKKHGKALAKRLGPAWHVRIWENLGWHSEAYTAGGRLTVSGGEAGRGGHFIAYLSHEPFGGCAFGAPSARRPEEAVRRVVEVALSRANEIMTLVRDVEAAGAVVLEEIDQRRSRTPTRRKTPPASRGGMATP